LVDEKVTSSVTKREGRENRGEEENPIIRFANTTKIETMTKPITVLPNPPLVEPTFDVFGPRLIVTKFL
jgi:hypothetical protein